VTATPPTTSDPVSQETERVRRIMDRLAPRYDRQMGRFEKRLFAGGRAWACSRASGDVLEIAAGTGLNLPHYPAGTRLTAVSGIVVALRMYETHRPIRMDGTKGVRPASPAASLQAD